MKQIKTLISSIALLIFTSCSLFWSSIVPDWYDKDYEDSEYIYARGRGNSQRKNIASKKAETAAQSEMSSEAQTKLREIAEKIRKSDGVAKEDPKAKKYINALKKVNLNISGISKIVNKEAIHSDNVYNVFILIRLRKSDLQKLYLIALEDI